ncbi:uncharacterized protein SPSK_04888 [Sporothrix schenckii 1099-18]|uniref:NIMA interactive protein n=2 Tax=Sporothrix schenckii TaxID=29908 RepID=U7Q4Z7_SPOS1|nr:uncharacterized protein SPSK_04888 [Sporothrix schenckii 1099-18]ERT02277.1 hypothetical protein HMPREF1624_00575 [Sporothrix schenckii ATCC 58251]KJR80483.1 hypothetical protein SPSK_04888 [Sporothrix schenckii 1099-18]
MTDIENLRTASLYINNQLLSRGLLRDGQTIDFADPAGRNRKSKEKAGGATDGNTDEKAGDNTADTMSRVISVVNDLILRRDRDAEHRESLSTALRTVRAESLRQSNDLQRAIERHAEAQRRADLGEAAEASLRAQLVAADAANRKLREEAARMRQQVAQTRASCANEVRKRDRQIDGLKKAVSDAGRARGERRSPAITTITISGGDSSSSTVHHPQHTPRSALGSLQSTPTARSSATNAAADATTTSEYDLRSETNAFLADLARGLSDDNEMLLDLVRHTSRRLQAMSGYVPPGEEDARGAPGEGATATSMVDCAALAAEMEAVLEHLRTILTNPSFVPIEEVVQRESEIGRLRDGWEKMEGRWKEAVHLLDGWRKRMATSGRSVNMEEIKMGLRLSPVRVRNVAETSLGLDLRMPPLQLGLNAVDEEAEDGEETGGYQGGEDGQGDDDDDKNVGVRNWPPLGRTPSPAETLHLVPAPDYAPGHEGLSDSESDTSSTFADDVDDDEGDFDDDGPNVQIIEQSIMVPSLEDVSSAPVEFSRSTPSPTPPPPEKPVLSKVTAAAIKEKEAERKPAKPKAAQAKGNQPGLRPSHSAGNRQGTKASSSSDTTKQTAKATTGAAPNTTTTTTAAVTRGRQRPGEVEDTAKERRQVRIAAAPATAAAAAAAVAEKPTARPAAPRVVASATTTITGLSRANSARATGGRPLPARQAGKPVTTTTAAASQPVSTLVQEKQRPASAASHASEASAASTAASEDSVALVPATGSVTTAAAAPTTRPVSSLASRKLTTAASAPTAPTTARPRRDRVQNRNASDEQTAAAPTTTASSSSSSSANSSGQMPPPSVPLTTIATAANRARSRSPIKTAAAGASGGSGGAGTTAGPGAVVSVTSRLPLPTSANANAPPPASPALNMATIAAKLAASEREADAARVRAKLKAARSGLAGAKAKAVPAVEAAPAAASAAAETEAHDVDPVKKTAAADEAAEAPLSTSVNSINGEPAQQPLRKKRDPKDKDQRRASKAASRRRSTLNPWELKSLMAGSVQGAAPAPATATETAETVAVEALS